MPNPSPAFPENVTVPAAAAFIGVPYGAAISSPECACDLTLSLLPNLDVITPETGLIKLIP